MGISRTNEASRLARASLGGVAAIGLLVPLSGPVAAQAAPAVPAAAGSAAGSPVGTAGGAVGSPRGDRRTRARRGVMGIAAVADDPLVGARVVVTDRAGNRQQIVSGAPRTTATGHFRVVVRSRATQLVVHLRGGRYGTHRLADDELMALADLGDIAEYVNVGTTVAAKYAAAHPKASFLQASRRVARFLGLPKPAAVFELGQLTHVRFSQHSPARLLRAANRHGGIDAYTTRLARQAGNGNARRTFAPEVYRHEYFGSGPGGLFTGQPAPMVGQGRSARKKKADASCDGPISCIVGYVGEAAASAATTAAVNGASATACAIGGNNSIAGGLLGCNATQAQLAQALDELGQIQTTLNNQSVELKNIQSLIQSIIQTGAYTTANVGVTVKNAKPFVLAMQALAPVAAELPAGQTLSSASTFPEVCSAVYTETSTITVGTQTQTPATACTDVYSYVEDWTGYELTVGVLGTGGGNGYLLSQGMFGVNNTTVSGDLLIPTYQASLADNGFILGNSQSAMNEKLAQLVGTQAATTIMTYSALTWYQTWTLQPTGCPAANFPSTYDYSWIQNNTQANYITACQVLASGWAALSIEAGIATNARAVLPHAGDFTANTDYTQNQVVIDTKSGQVWWACAIDMSGIYNANGLNPMYPTCDWGEPDLGYNTASVAWAPPSGSYALQPTQLLTAFPDTFTLAPAGSSDLNNQLVSDAIASAPTSTASANAALSYVGFIGPGQADVMWWDYLVNGIGQWTFETMWQYPGTGWGKQVKCPGLWPQVSPYSCTTDGNFMEITGVWGTSFQETTLTTGSSSQVCATGTKAKPTLYPWGSSPPPNMGSGAPEVCTGPDVSSQDPSYYGLMLDTNPGTIQWTDAMVTAWESTGATALPLPPGLKIDSVSQSTQGLTISGEASGSFVSTGLTAFVYCYVGTEATSLFGSTPITGGTAGATGMAATPATVTGSWSSPTAVTCTFTPTQLSAIGIAAGGTAYVRMAAVNPTPTSSAPLPGQGPTSYTLAQPTSVTS